MPDTDEVLTALAEQLAALDEQTVEQEIAGFQAEVNRLNAKIQARARALTMKQAARAAIGSPPAAESTAPERDATPGTARRVSAQQKRDLVREVLARAPRRPWPTQDVRHALTEAGVDADAGTPIRRILWDMGNAGTARRVSEGLYELVEPGQERMPS